MLGVSSTSSGGRFVEDVASIPIKKRRITMVRSPSPPPEDAVATTSDFSEVPGLLPAEEECEQQSDMLKNIHVMEGDVDEPGGHVNEETRESAELELALGFQPTNGGFGSRSVQGYREKNEKGLVLRLNSGYLNGNRSDWDLNTPVESWENEAEFVDADSTGKGLNVSIAPFEAPSCPSTDVSTVERGEELPDGNSGTGYQLQGDRRSGTLMNSSNVYAHDSIEYSTLKLHEMDGLGPRENSSGASPSVGDLDVVVKIPKSSPAEDQHLIETGDEDRIVCDANIVPLCAVDESALSLEDTDTVGGRPASPKDGLEQQSTGYAIEVAYARDDGYDDEDELVSDTEKVAVGGMKDDCQGENEERIERVDEEEQMEVEDVDYGDSDCRDVDDLGMDRNERGKGVEFMEPVDARHERDWDDGQRSGVEQKNHDVHHGSQFGEALQVALDEENTKAGETESAVTDMEQSTMKDNKVDSIDSKSTKSLDNKRTGGEVGLFFKLDRHEAGARSREEMYPCSSKQKSSGWDQLPEGFKSAEDAFKSVKDIIGMQGQHAPAWFSRNVRDPGGQMGQIFSRRSFPRMDGRFEERVGTDDIKHAKGKFYTMDGRDGGVCTRRGQSIGRNGSSPRAYNSIRSDPCMDSTTGHWCPNRHRSPPDHEGGQDNFGPQESRTAAAASAAKVESNSFVITLDGTLTKAGRAGMRGRRACGTLMRRTAAMDNEESMNFGMQMGMEPGRAMNMVHESVDTREQGGQKRYRGPLFVNTGWDIRNHQLAERNRGFSPVPRKRLTPHVSQPCSRSRTRPPRLRPSPRGIVGIGPRTDPRNYSRSPTALRSEGRMERLKSPLFHREGHLGHKLSFLRFSKSQHSPPQAPKWPSDKRDVDHLKDSGYKKRFARPRSPSRRLSLNGAHESGLMDLPRKFNRREYYGHVHSSRASEVDNDSRYFKHEENKSIRLKQSDTSGKLAEINGLDAKQFQHQDDGNDCQACRSHGKDVETSKEQDMRDVNSS